MTSNTEKLRVLAKTHLSDRDICTLLDIGHSKASQLRQDFVDMHTEKYGYVPRIVPTGLFCAWMHIDEKRIKEFASIESQTKNDLL